MKHYHFSRINSTNDYAKELLKEEDKVLVTADFQYGGRGRNMKKWEGDFGSNVYCSFGIRHPEEPKIEELPLYQALGCLIVKDTLSELTKGEKFIIKYPNDIYAVQNGIPKKISGILIEHSFAGNKCLNTVIGIGINVDQKVFSLAVENEPVSLAMMGYKITSDVIIERLIRKYEEYRAKSPEEIFKIWAGDLNLAGKTIRLTEDNSFWNVVEVMPDCMLLVKDINGNSTKIIDNGDSIRYKLI